MTTRSLITPRRRPINRRQCLLAVAAAGLLPAAKAQDLSARNRELYLYKGADRDGRLLDGARKEGQLSLYTSLNTKDSGPITDAFEKKTGVKVLLWRSSSEKVLQRGVTEARAGRFSCDVFETNGPEMEALSREKLLAEFYCPHFKDLPPASFPKHRLWVADRFNFFTIGYNTNLIKPDEVPTSYEDLLHPRYAGKLGIEASDTDWFAAVVKHMGEAKGLAFFRKLAAAKPQIRSGHTLLGELVSSGEVPIAATIYNHNIERLAVKGAPVKWKALNPTFGRPNAVGVVPRAPHPHAALLFADFLLSPQGQELIKERNRVPASTAVETALNKFPYEMIDPVITLDEADKWDKLWSELFLKGQKVQRDTE
jgi:iron(III) transport system substrate-binding protein